MFTKENRHFVYMTMATAVATAVVLEFMIQAYANASQVVSHDLRIALSVLLIPFGAALWVAPASKLAIEGLCVGLITGSGFVSYVLFLDNSIGSDELRAYFFQRGALLHYMFIVCGLMIVTTSLGYASGAAIHLAALLRNKNRSRK